jgi:hypothetical protein
MDTEEEEIRILRILADDWDKNPSNRSNGIHMRRLGAMAGAYLNNPLYSVANLRRKGFVSRIGNNIILTDKGYSSVRPFVAKGGAWFNPSNPWVYLLLTVIAGIIVGIVFLLIR